MKGASHLPTPLLTRVLGTSVHPDSWEVFKKVTSPLIPRNREAFTDYLSVISQAFREAEELIDWDLLEERGLPSAKSRRLKYASLSRLLSTSVADSGGRKGDSGPGIAPTFGVGLGALYFLERHSMRMRKFSRQVDWDQLGFQLGGPSFFQTIRDEAPDEWGRFLRWCNACPLNPEEKEEARFGSRACLLFFKRHTGSVS